MFDFLKNRIDAILPVILLVFSFAYLSYNAIRPGERPINPFGRAIQTLVSYPQKMYTAASYGIHGLGKRHIYLSNIETENEALKKQVEGLKTERAQLNEIVMENLRLKKFLSFKETYPAKILTCAIIGIGPSWDMRTMTMDCGAKDGVMPPMVAITSDGVVGRVIGPGGSSKTSALSSQILLVLDRRSAIDAIDQRSRVRGIIRGNRYSLTLDFLEQTDDVKEGDVIVTNGMGGIFPKGLTLGVVTGNKILASGINYQAPVWPAVDFKHLEEIMVILKAPEAQ